MERTHDIFPQEQICFFILDGLLVVFVVHCLHPVCNFRKQSIWDSMDFTIRVSLQMRLS